MAETQKIQKRQVAFAVSIEDLLTGSYVKLEGWNPNYVKMPWGLKVSRATIVGTVLQKSENLIELDDTSGIFTVRTFEHLDALEKVSVGQQIQVIGKVREFSGDLYMVPEAITPVSKDMVLFHKNVCLLVKQYFKQEKIPETIDDDNVSVDISTPEEKIVQTEESSEAKSPTKSMTEKILEYIETHDAGNGINRQEILSHFQDPHVGDYFEKLINDGDIFEITTDVYKVLK